MSIPIIDTLNPLGNFPVVNANDVNCNGKKLDEVINESATKNYVDTNFAKKSEIPSTTGMYIKPASGIPKSDMSSSVQTSLSKADTAIQEHQSLSNYALSSDVSAINNRVSVAETNITSLSSRMDNFASLEEGSTTGDAELADIRVQADGTTAEDAGTAVRNQFNTINNKVSKVELDIIIDQPKTAMRHWSGDEISRIETWTAYNNKFEVIPGSNITFSSTKFHISTFNSNGVVVRTQIAPDSSKIICLRNDEVKINISYMTEIETSEGVHVYAKTIYGMEQETRNILNNVAKSDKIDIIANMERINRRHWDGTKYDIIDAWSSVVDAVPVYPNSTLEFPSANFHVSFYKKNGTLSRKQIAPTNNVITVGSDEYSIRVSYTTASTSVYINSNTPRGESLSLQTQINSKLDDAWSNDYGLYKYENYVNLYTELAKYTNSRRATKNTRSTIKRITKTGINFGHMGQLCIKDGTVYATFIQNSGTDGEKTYSNTSEVVLAIFTLSAWESSNFNPDTDVTIKKIGKLGDSFAGFTAKSIFKDNSMCLVDNYIYITFSFITNEDGKAYIFSTRYNIASSTFDQQNVGTLVDATYTDPTVIGTTTKINYVNDFSDEKINKIYGNHGKSTSANGLIELVSPWTSRAESGVVWYYATGIMMGTSTSNVNNRNNGFIVKTDNFVRFELVAVIPWNDNGSAEVISCVRRNRLYIAARQDYGIPYLLFGAYDFDNKKFIEPYKIPDGNVRPWLYKTADDANIILINTVDESTRKYANMYGVDYTNHARDLTPVKLNITLKECGSYFAVTFYNGEQYFVCTKETISFGKLVQPTTSNTDDAVLDKLCTALGLD